MSTRGQVRLLPEAGGGAHRRDRTDRDEQRGAAPVLAANDRVEQRLVPRPAEPAERALPAMAAGVPGRSAEFELAGQVLGVVAVLALCFLIELTVLGNLRHDRDQAQLADLFRIELAQPGPPVALAPVGPFDDAGKPLAAGAPVALLEIPKLGLREVVGEGTSSEILMSGPGHRRDTPLPGQVGISVIAGRRATYGAPFRSIDRLRRGDPITVTTGQGKHSFKVLDVRYAGNPVPPLPTSGQGQLTLVTTAVPAGGILSAFRPIDVVRVDAALVSAAQSRPPQMPSVAVPPADALMAGDSSALLSVVGWSMLLLAAGVAIVWVRFRTGWWQAWVIGVPVLVTLGLTASDALAALLPNLL
ncbi:MAG: class E sortase [Pseudonocardiaceae bacterium]